MKNLITAVSTILTENRLNDKRFNIFNITDVLATLKKHGMNDEQLSYFKSNVKPKAGKISWAEVNTAIGLGGHTTKTGVNELKPSFIHDVLADLKK